jgi:hypothetical protein
MLTEVLLTGFNSTADTIRACGYEAVDSPVSPVLREAGPSLHRIGKRFIIRT